MRYGTFRSVQRLARSLRLAFRADQRTQFLTLPRLSAPVISDTGGHCVSIAQLDRGLTVELWLDMYAGLTSPRVWVGFYSSSRNRIARLLGLASSAGFGDSVIHRYWRDVRRQRGIWQFKHPLSSDQFDVQLLESYGSYFYLGLYLPYGWPLTRHTERAIVRHSVNYIGAMSGAYTSAGARAHRRTVGPWNRPDKAVEVAAIRYVKVRLLRSGYRVRSREREICGYDLHATREGDELHVEVKGVSGEDPHFFISRTELKEADRDSAWRLAVVLRALTRPHMLPYVSGMHLRRAFDLKPTQWFATARGLTRR